MGPLQLPLSRSLFTANFTDKGKDLTSPTNIAIDLSDLLIANHSPGTIFIWFRLLSTSELQTAIYSHLFQLKSAFHAFVFDGSLIPKQNFRDQVLYMPYMLHLPIPPQSLQTHTFLLDNRLDLLS